MGTLYENIKALCDEKGVTGGKMCSDIGLSRNFMTEQKSGRRSTATTKTIQKIADYFGVTSDEVISGKKHEPDSEASKINKVEYVKQLVGELSQVEMIDVMEEITTLLKNRS